MNDAVRRVLEAMTYGLYVVTCGYERKAYAMVGSWVTQISYEPPMVLAAVRENRPIRPLIPEAGMFGLNLMHSSQIGLIGTLREAEPLETPEWMERATKTGVPVVKGILGFLELKLEHFHAPGDHMLFTGRIVGGEMEMDGRQLNTVDLGVTYIGEK